MIYKFIFQSKREIGMRKKAILLTPKNGGDKSYSFTREEFDLVKLFDGRRSVGDVSEQFFRDSANRVSIGDLEKFISQMLKDGFLEEMEVEHNSTPTLLEQHRRYKSFTRRRRGNSSVRQSELSEKEKTDLRYNENWEEEDVEEKSEIGGSTYKTDPDTITKEKRELALIRGKRADLIAVHSQKKSAANDNSAEQDNLSNKLVVDVDGSRTSKNRGFRPAFLLRIRIQSILFLGRLISLPAANIITRMLLVIASLLVLYGVWTNRVEFFRDLHLLLTPLNLAHTLLVSMLTVNLLSQLARSAAFKEYTGRLPEFGIILAFKIIPRFFANVFEQKILADINIQIDISRAGFYATLFLYFLSFFGWLAAKESATFLPILLVGIGTLSVIHVIIQLNPLSKRYGYLLLSKRLGVRYLRERAIASLFGSSPGEVRPRRGYNAAASSWGLKVYGALVLIYVIVVSFLIFRIIGGWLESHWGGLGVIVFLTAMLVVAHDPIKKVLAFKKRQRKRQTGLQVAKLKDKKKARESFIWALIIIIIVWAGFIPYRYEPGGDFVILPNKRVDVRAFIDGDIREIFVKEGDFVINGQLLARMADDEENTNVKVTEARYAEARAALALAEEGAKSEEIDLARQRIRTALTKYNFSNSRVERMAGLADKYMVSEQEYENALSTAEVDKEQLSEVERSLDLLLSDARPQEIDALQAQVQKELAELEYHKKQLGYTKLRAQISGQVVSGSLLYAVGDYLKKGDPLATIEDTQTVLAEIKVPQADIGEVKPGCDVRLKSWAYPDTEFGGIVRSIAPVAETSNYGKVIRVLTETDNRDRLLKSEMTGYAKIYGEMMPAAFAFTRMLRRFVLVEFWSWIP